MNSFLDHPAVSDFDISNYVGLRGANFYLKDTSLQRVVNRAFQDLSNDEFSAISLHLTGYGELVGGILDELTEACHKEGKYGEIRNYDKTGKRIDEVVYCPEQRESRKISYDYGIVNLDFHPEWKFPFRSIHRYALAYLNNLNGEGGVACPLAMTDGLILALKEIGTEEQKSKYLPLLAGKGSKSHFMAGQYVTERVGGSNVSANRTTAKQRSDGKWILNGEKWFCSNPGDLWVTTGRIEGTSTIGLFLVPRFKENGELNGHHILRKKDIIGSRGKVTVEIIYRDLEAETLGRPNHGIANLIRYIISVSRLHVGLGACGNSKRAVMEAICYSNWRTAYGKKIKDFHAFQMQLAEMQIQQVALTWVNFRSISLLEENQPVTEMLVPLMKLISSSKATELTQKAMLCLGGNGIIGDFSPLPRLHNDSIINETWEGTHLIISDHIIHAMRKKKVRDSFFETIEKLSSKAESLQNCKQAITWLRNQTNSIKESFELEAKEWQDLNRIWIAKELYNCFAVAELLEQYSFDQEEVIHLFLQGFLESLSNGKDAPKHKTSIFFNIESLEKMISY